MFPEHFYITDLGKIIYFILYLPAVLVFLWSLRRQIKHLLWQVVVPLGLILITLPFWDVYMIGRDADRLCKTEAGLHVYKTVEAEGFLGSSSMKFWSAYGYTYLENGGGKYMSRYTMQDGEVKHQYVKEFISKYASGTGDNHKIITKSISRSSHVVIDRATKEVLGDWIFFSIYPGRFDGALLKLTGSGPVQWHCGFKSPDGNEIGTRDLVKATIKPLKNRGIIQ